MLQLIEDKKYRIKFKTKSSRGWTWVIQANVFLNIPDGDTGEPQVHNLQFASDKTYKTPRFSFEQAKVVMSVLFSMHTDITCIAFDDIEYPNKDYPLMNDKSLDRALGRA